MRISSHVIGWVIVIGIVLVDIRIEMVSHVGYLFSECDTSI